MKYKLPFTLLLIAFFALMSCSSKSQDSTSKILDKGNTLIVYLSRTNNTKAIAEIIQKNVGGTLVRLL